MPGGALVTPAGDLRPGTLAGLPTGPVTVVSAFGARGTGQSSLLNALLRSTELPVAGAGASTCTQTTLGAAVACHPGDSSAANAAPPRALIAIDAEGFDGVDRAREDLRDRTANLAFSLADVILFNVRMNDLNRVESNGVSALRICLTESLKLQDAGVVPSPPPGTKIAFLVVVRDYEAEDLPRELLINGFLLEMQTMYDSVSKPSRCPSRVSDMFEFEFVTLPSAILSSEAFEKAVVDLSARLIDPFSDQYLFEDGAYARPNGPSAAEQLPTVASAAWDSLEEETARDMPAEKELMAAFACASAMRKVFDKYKRSVREWERQTVDGNVIDAFGDASSELAGETLCVFDEDAAPHRQSKAFARKRAELKDQIDADLYDLFARQANKLRNVAYGMFKETIEDISLDEPSLEKSINKALKDAQRFFVEQADKLRPRGSSWRYDNESKELASHMRDDATERLQQARLEDYASGARGRRGRRGRRTTAGGGAERPKRQPIAISFHYLNPAPFGFKDSRFDKLSSNDTVQYTTDMATSSLPVPILPSQDEPWDRDFIYSDTLKK
jgi:hypothetical protein